jgi:vacuolar protein sorting-associated protein 35
VVTQVFPDEYHLNTLDQLLPAIARLNPHVNIKSIVVGIMSRLSNYAEADSEKPASEDRQKAEDEAIAALMEKTRLDKEAKAAKEEASPQANGESDESKAGDESAKGAESIGDESTIAAESNAGDDKTEPKKKGIPPNVKLFEIFYGQVAHLVQAQRLPIPDTIALLVALSHLALNIYPSRLDYIDQVLSYANEKVNQFANSADLHSQATQAHILELLLAPIKAYHSLFTTLALPSYLPLLHAQSYPTRRAVAREVSRSMLQNEIKITSTENLEGVLEILKVLIKEGMTQAAGYPGLSGPRRSTETEETIEEQGWLARTVHLIQGPDNNTQFKLLQIARKALAEGNERIRYTTPALFTLCIKLARKFKLREHYEDDWQTQSSTLYKFMHTMISQLHTRVNGAAELCLRLFVTAGQIADQCGFEEVAYEFFAQAFTIYEEAVSDSRAQFQAVCIFAGALHQTRNFTKENYDTLITKCALHGSKLLKKPDQCRAVYLASHLWWATDIRARGEDESRTVSGIPRWRMRLMTIALPRW